MLLYARIKGVDEERLTRVANEKMKQMDLAPFRTIQVLNGNMRALYRYIRRC